MVPCLDLPIKSRLAERVESEIVRYRITHGGEEALRQMQELKKLIVETGEEGVA